jgi:hypothetical protein
MSKSFSRAGPRIICSEAGNLRIAVPNAGMTARRDGEGAVVVGVHEIALANAEPEYFNARAELANMNKAVIW